MSLRTQQLLREDMARWVMPFVLLNDDISGAETVFHTFFFFISACSFVHACIRQGQEELGVSDKLKIHAHIYLSTSTWNTT